MTRSYLRCDAGAFEKVKDIPSDIPSSMLILETMESDQRRLQLKGSARPLIGNPVASEGKIRRRTPR